VIGRLLVLLLALAPIGCGRDTPRTTPPPTTTGTAVAPAATDSLVHLAVPAPGDTVRSPLLVSGEARGTWFFEASFPIRLLDADGREVAVTHATAGSDWMTTEFVPFSASVTFASPAAGSIGTLVLRTDNPSALPEFEDGRRIPIVFGGRGKWTR